MNTTRECLSHLNAARQKTSRKFCLILLVKVTQAQTRMALRKQINKDACGVPSESQQSDEDTQEDGAVDNQDDKDEHSSSLLSLPSARQKRRRERENKSKPKDMTEEEMMDLALRLSEQEASDSALRLQQEEEAMMKAIQESMVSQAQPCPPSQSQSLRADADASLRLCPRRKLSYSNGRRASAIDQGPSDDICTAETELNQHPAAKETGGENNNRNKKRKRKEGSPLQEMPDLSQTQNVYSQTSPCSSESVSVPLDSQESSDSTQIDDCQLRKSPVFPSTGYRAEIHVPRLSQDLLETCKTSGFVLCSQDSWTSTQKSLLAQPKSQTFPKSSNNPTACPKSPVFSEADQGDDGEMELSVEYLKSPVFGRNTQHERSPSACKPHVRVCNPTCENSGFIFSSQESLSSSVRSASCRPKSPVFPRSPSPPKNLPPPEKSPVFSETGQGQTEQNHGCSTSPVFGRTGQRGKTQADVQKSVAPSAAELVRSDSDVNPPETRYPSQSLGQDSDGDHGHDGRFNKITTSSVDAQELNPAETELTSDMTLLWSDEDEDITPVGSPSPEERPVHRTNSQAASLNHVSAASPGTNRSNCSLRCVSGGGLSSFEDRSSPNKHISLGPSSSSTSTCQQLLSTTEEELRPVSSGGAVRQVAAPPAEPAGGPTVHYYWGVPFCPRGLDPDAYTQVILAQMDVYDKSLKQAQRCLLRKAQWGEAVLPRPEKSPSPESQAESSQRHFPQRRGLRLRGRKLCEAADSPPAKAEEDREDEEEEKKEGGEGEEGQVDIDDCEVCPETQLSDNDDDITEDLTMATDAGAELRPESPNLPEVEMILRDDSPAGAEPQEEEEMEVDAPVDGKTEGHVPVSGGEGGRQNLNKEEVTGHREDPDVEEIKDGGPQRSVSPELGPAAVPHSPEANVDCPICQGSFPVTKIEFHAAFCDGEVAVVDERRPEVDCFQASLKPRRKRTRRAEATAEETNNPSDTGKNQEKCYICHQVVPLRDYSRHTEVCIQRRTAKAEGKGNLLSALEQTETRDSEARPSGSKVQPREVIDLRDDDEEEDDVPAFRISNSPVRSFTPISEATDCLIDFRKQQRAKKPSQRRR
ncbi:BRCA1-A complex subunit RAP80 isoform X2 [Toxotes jaculatrix]|uniref:BRCA1-A complex subunit RAP80 isoform X2 n=1 Tax=Toxotes jaculatrix TaxID=941984 RepID=UPI001B3AA731|nr:BRCA1-A complex subunit RAP80 isoform X2 [Toxotes jaculatrix]